MTINLKEHPCGYAKFRNGKFCSLFFAEAWADQPGAVAWRQENGWWFNHKIDGTNLEKSGGLWGGSEWDILEWHPLIPAEGERPEYCNGSPRLAPGQEQRIEQIIGRSVKFRAADNNIPGGYYVPEKEGQAA